MRLRILIALSLVSTLSACTECMIDGINCTNEAPPFFSIAAGRAHTCAGSDVGVVCWGAGIPLPGSPDVLRAAGDVTCGFYTGAEAVRCSGQGPAASGPPEGRYLGLALGQTHGCAITHEFDGPGPTLCWGTDAGVHLGFGFRELAAGADHTCGVNLLGNTACWGRNDLGQSTPPAGVQLHGLVANDGYSCGLDSANAITCWGLQPPGAPTGAYAELAAGPSHACARSVGGAIHCWGDTSDGRSSPPAGTFAAIAVGDRHGCAISLDAGVTCWGANDEGQASSP